MEETLNNVVSFNEAKRLKVMGFPQDFFGYGYFTINDEPILFHFKDNNRPIVWKIECVAPSYSEVYKWLYEFKDIKILDKGGIIIEGKLDTKNLYRCPITTDETIIKGIRYILIKYGELQF